MSVSSAGKFIRHRGRLIDVRARKAQTYSQPMNGVSAGMTRASITRGIGVAVMPDITGHAHVKTTNLQRIKTKRLPD